MSDNFAPQHFEAILWHRYVWYGLASNSHACSFMVQTRRIAIIVLSPQMKEAIRHRLLIPSVEVRVYINVLSLITMEQ